MSAMLVEAAFLTPGMFKMSWLFLGFAYWGTNLIIMAVCYFCSLLFSYFFFYSCPFFFLSSPFLPLCLLLFLYLLFLLSYYFPKSFSSLVCEVCFHILLFFLERYGIFFIVSAFEKCGSQVRRSTCCIKYNNLFLLILWQMQLIEMISVS